MRFAGPTRTTSSATGRAFVHHRKHRSPPRCVRHRPPRGVSCCRTKLTAAMTSPTPSHRAMRASRLSIIPFQSKRPSSWPGCAGARSAPRRLTAKVSTLLRSITIRLPSSAVACRSSSFPPKACARGQHGRLTVTPCSDCTDTLICSARFPDCELCVLYLPFIQWRTRSSRF